MAVSQLPVLGNSLILEDPSPALLVPSALLSLVPDSHHHSLAASTVSGAGRE